MKKINPKIEQLPNYLWHVFAIANLWNKENLEYTQKYQNMISIEDREFLHTNREFLAWGNGRGGGLTGLLFFIPLGFDFMNFEAYLSYLDLLIDSTKTRNWEMFKQKYEFNYDMSEIVFPKEQIEYLDRYLGIIMNYYSNYSIKLWPEHEAGLRISAEFIDGYFKDLRAIEKWEKFLNKQYPPDELNIVLTVANKNLPSANNLSRTRYNFYFQPDSKEGLCKFILHEIGTNLLEKDLHLNYKDKELQTALITANNLVWQSFEALAEYSKTLIFKVETDLFRGEMFGGGRYRFPDFFRFYTGYDLDKSDLDYAAVMKEAVLFVVNKVYKKE